MWKTQVQHWQWHSPHRWPETKWRSTGAPGGDLGKWHCTAGSSTGAPPPPPPRQQCPSASMSGTPGCGDTLLVQVLLHNCSTVSMLSCIRLHCSGRLTSQQFGRVAGYIVGCPSPGEDVQLGLLRRRARPTVGKIRKGASQPPFKLKLFELFIKIGPHRSLHHRNIPATKRVAILPFHFSGLRFCFSCFTGIKSEQNKILGHNFHF